MIRLEPKDKKALLRTALGMEEADLAICNCRLVNVFTGEIYPAVVYVKDGFIAHVEDEELSGPYKAASVYDGQGRYLIPGLIDSHMHIESSMMTPRNFAKAVIPHGTTTIIHDPHEIANVYGREGVVYMHDAGSDLPMRQLVDIQAVCRQCRAVRMPGLNFLQRISTLWPVSRGRWDWQRSWTFTE